MYIYIVFDGVYIYILQALRGLLPIAGGSVPSISSFVMASSESSRWFRFLFLFGSSSRSLEELLFDRDVDGSVAILFPFLVMNDRFLIGLVREHSNFKRVVVKKPLESMRIGDVKKLVAAAMKRLVER